MGKKVLICSLFVLCLLLADSSNPCGGLDFPEPPGKLSKVHSGLQGEKNCIQCHTAGNKVDLAKCLGCHKDLALRIKAGTGFHKDKTEDCNACHSEHNGENYSLMQWDPQEFDHAETGYLLTGMHQRVKGCDTCHTSQNSPLRKYSQSYFLKDNRCSACHSDTHRGNYPDCTDCHTTNDWRVDIW